MDNGRHACRQVDAAVLPELQRRPDAASAIALAYNLRNFLPRLALARSGQQWSLTTPQAKLSKTGAKVVRRSGCVTLQMAEVAVPRELFAAILERIQRLAVRPALVQRE